MWFESQTTTQLFDSVVYILYINFLSCIQFFYWKYIPTAFSPLGELCPQKKTKDLGSQETRKYWKNLKLRQRHGPVSSFPLASIGLYRYLRLKRCVIKLLALILLQCNLFLNVISLKKCVIKLLIVVLLYFVVPDHQMTQEMCYKAVLKNLLC